MSTSTSNNQIPTPRARPAGAPTQADANREALKNYQDAASPEARFLDPKGPIRPGETPEHAIDRMVGPVPPPAPLPSELQPHATTQRFDDGSTLTRNADGTFSSTPSPQPTTQRFDDGSSLTNDGYGNYSSTPSPQPTTQHFDDGSSLTNDGYGNYSSTPSPPDPAPAADPPAPDPPINE